MQLPGIFAQEYKAPPIAPGLSNNKDLAGYTVKYKKIDLDNPSEVLDAQDIETRGINGSGDIVLMDRDKFTFMDRMFLILHYLEKNPA